MMSLSSAALLDVEVVVVAPDLQPGGVQTSLLHHPSIHHTEHHQDQGDDNACDDDDNARDNDDNASDEETNACGYDDNTWDDYKAHNDNKNA